MVVTVVPDLLDAVVATLTSGLPDVQVMDGPALARDLEPVAIVVGMNPEGGQAVEVERVHDGLERWREKVTLWCLASVDSGETDLAPLRQKARVLLGSVAELCHAGIPGLPPALLDLGPQMSWAQVQAEEGAAVEVVFAVTADVLL